MRKLNLITWLPVFPFEVVFSTGPVVMDFMKINLTPLLKLLCEISSFTKEQLSKDMLFQSWHYIVKLLKLTEPFQSHKLRKFLELTRYYRQEVPELSALLKPLMTILSWLFLCIIMKFTRGTNFYVPYI